MSYFLHNHVRIKKKLSFSFFSRCINDVAFSVGRASTPAEKSSPLLSVVVGCKPSWKKEIFGRSLGELNNARRINFGWAVCVIECVQREMVS